jgi:hypothetical protein
MTTINNITYSLIDNYAAVIGCDISVMSVPLTIEINSVTYDVKVITSNFTTLELSTIILNCTDMTIENNAFTRLASLTSFELNTIITTLTIGDYAFSECPITILILNSYYNLTIGDYAFYLCPIKTLSLTATTTLTIGDYAFSECLITTLYLTSDTLTIGDYAFQTCPITTLSLTSDTLTIGDDAFYGCNITTLSLTATTLTIGDSAFQTCPITTLSLTATTLTIGDSAFQTCPITTLSLTSDTLTIGENAFIFCPITTVSLTSDTLTIGNASFQQCSIKTLSLTATTLTIGNASFRQCPITTLSLTATTLTIGDAAFYICHITTVDLTSDTLTIGDYAFQACPITTLSLTSDTLTIGDYAFNGCNITTLSLTSDTLTIGDYAFQACPITTLSLTSDTLTIGDYAFQACPITTLSLTSDTLTIGDYAFITKVIVIVFRNVTILTSTTYYSPTTLILINTSANYSTFSPTNLIYYNSNIDDILYTNIREINISQIITIPSSTTCMIRVPSMLISESFYITYGIDDNIFNGNTFTFSNLIPSTFYSKKIIIYGNITSYNINSRLSITPILLLTLSISFTTATPVSNICFFKDTPILTDQGTILIQSIKNHTIHSDKLILTKTLYTDSYLVRFEKDALAQNIPSLPTIMTKNHLILYKGKWLEAKRFLRFEHVNRIPYDGSILYNVLMTSHTPLCVNNLTCESLSPTSPIALLYGMHKQKKIKSVMSSILSL